MKRLFTLYLTIFLTWASFGQNKIYIDEPFVGLPWRQTKVVEIDSLKQLPTRIPFIVSNLFKTSMTDFVNNIFFIKGQIIDIESWATKDSAFQTEYKFVIPKYELFFELRDTLINIKSYCFRVSLDQYGQITSFEWPREGFNKRADFVKGKVLKNEAVKYAVKKNYKTKSCMYDMKFDDYKQRLNWHISFLQKSTGDKFDFSKEYRTIVIDAKSKFIIEELITESVGVSD